MSTHEPPFPQNPPPPPGGYGAPPPPPGGYGAPPPPLGGYGAPPTGPQAWDLGAAFAYGWKKFQENAGQIILAAVALFLAIGVMAAVGIGLAALLTSPEECTYNTQTMTRDCTGGTGLVLGLVVAAITAALVILASLVVGAGLIRGALGITEGKPFRAAEVFKLDNLGSVLLTSLIIAGLTFVGILLCYLPGIAVAFATSYALYFVIDKGMAPMEAIKASVVLVKDNLGTTFVWYLVGGIVGSAGAIACGVGALVTYPLVLIGTAYTYKVLTSQQVAP
ncbi:hypothetical protein [Nocardioides dongkuii]|uniref:hypothetical protein n=1 Tax=Nocardioides dongkuii TaxID=2760089 RepID=UPI0015FC6E64|nr:hypothetical protein [Nocardioides dongkuii]